MKEPLRLLLIDRDGSITGWAGRRRAPAVMEGFRLDAELCECLRRHYDDPAMRALIGVLADQE